LTGSQAQDDGLSALEADIGHRFADRDLLVEALTHSSVKARSVTYERLEFLGDRVLGLVLAAHFYALHPEDDEGGLSLRFHAAARQSTLADVARRLGLARHIRVQSGMDVEANESILSDVVESLMAAIYLDGGMAPAQALVLAHWPLDAEAPARDEKDAKSQLQEFAMSRGLALPHYRLVARSGPDHAPDMTYAVSIEGFAEIEATAGSRKQAEQRAAARLLEVIAGGGHGDD
jgi:ribonuclease-3